MAMVPASAGALVRALHVTGEEEKAEDDVGFCRGENVQDATNGRRDKVRAIVLRGEERRKL